MQGKQRHERNGTTQRQHCNHHRERVPMLNNELDGWILIHHCQISPILFSRSRRGLGGNRVTAKMVTQQATVAGDTVMASKESENRPDAYGIVCQYRLADIPFEALDGKYIRAL